MERDPLLDLDRLSFKYKSSRRIQTAGEMDISVHTLYNAGLTCQADTPVHQDSVTSTFLRGFHRLRFWSM